MQYRVCAGVRGPSVVSRDSRRDEEMGGYGGRYVLDRVDSGCGRGASEQPFIFQDDVDDDAEVINEQEQKTREVCAEIDEGEHWLNEQLPAEQRDTWLRVFKIFDDAWHEVEAEGAKTEVEVAVPESEELPVFSQEQTYQLLTKTIEIEHQEPWLNKHLPVEQREAWSRVVDIFDDARRELEGEESINARTIKTKYSQVRGFKADRVDRATENKSAPNICASQLSWQGNTQGLDRVGNLQHGRASKKSRPSKYPVHNPIRRLENITNLDSAALPSNPHSIYQSYYDELIYPTHGMPYILGR